ncbi:hypothetical protein HYU22_05110 [Candidatus Woesearchaeota archaeon]|nr:hypothetical protein [Candidatus Woesearchaeota archaeon]
MGKYRRKSTPEKKCGKEINSRFYQPPYSPRESHHYKSSGNPLDRISEPGPLERVSTSQDPLDRISGPSPLERISTSGDPLDRISYGYRRRRY